MSSRQSALTETDYFDTPIHRLLPAQAASQPVSPFSRWADPQWWFAVDTAGYGPVAIANWDFELPGGSSLDPPWSTLLELGRRLVWSILHNSQRGRRPKPLSIPEIAGRTRYLLQWMAWNDYRDFSELDSAAAADFVGSLREDKIEQAVPGHEMTILSLSRYIDLLCRIFEQSTELDNDSAAVMPAHPFMGLSALAVAKKHAKKKTGSIPPVPDEIFVPVMVTAAEWIEVRANDIFSLIDQYLEGVAVSRHLRSNNAWHINKRLVGFQFDDGGCLGRPWREPLISSRNELWGPIQELQSLIQNLRSSCVITIQGGTGIRISEVAGLQSGPSGPAGWPACVDVRPSLTGVNDIFFIKGRIYKNSRKWKETEWLAGMRPAGSDYVPGPIKAIIVLERLHEHWRKLAGSTDLIIALSSAQGLRRVSKQVSALQVDALNLGQKAFVRDHVALPDLHRAWNLTTHQWRNSFAVYMARSDGRLIPAVADHFHHMSMAATEQGYIGNDAMLLGVMDDAASREASRLLFEAAHGRTIVAGKMADIIDEQAEQIRNMFGDDGTDDEKVSRVADLLKSEEIRVWPSRWGDCFFRSETARCHFLAKGAFDLSARRPDYAQRRPSVCCVCANLMASEAHTQFWLDRHQANVSCYRENKAIGDRVAAAVAAERMRTSTAVLRKLQVAVDKLSTKETANGKRH